MRHIIEIILSFIGSKEKFVHCKIFLFTRTQDLRKSTDYLFMHLTPKPDLSINAVQVQKCVKKWNPYRHKTKGMGTWWEESGVGEL